jgi:hypothetical protein
MSRRIKVKRELELGSFGLWSLVFVEQRLNAQPQPDTDTDHLTFLHVAYVYVLIRPHNKGGRFAAKMGFCGIPGTGCLFKDKPIKTLAKASGSSFPM